MGFIVALLPTYGCTLWQEALRCARWDFLGKIWYCGSGSCNFVCRTLSCDAKIYPIMNQTSGLVFCANPARVQWSPIPKTNDQKPRLLEFFARHNASVLRKVGLDCSRSTYYKYHSVEQHIRAYLHSQCNLTDLAIDAFDRDLLVGFHAYLLRDLHCRKNTVWIYLNALKHILTLARKQGLARNDPFSDYKVQNEFVRRNFLSTNELMRLVALENLAPSVRLVRDAFLFSCFTGLSFIDIKLLRAEHIRKIGSRCWIETARHKTGVQVQVRLFDLPLAILKKYAADDPRAPIFPLPSNSWCNACLSRLMRRVGIMKHITFHAARHTFATTLTLSQGIPIETIAKLLGHRNIRTTQIYATVTHDYLDSEMNRLSKRIDPIGARWKG